MPQRHLYASWPDVQALTPWFATWHGSTRPTRDGVDKFLEAVSDELDAALANERYSTPVSASATVASLALRNAAAKGAAYHVTLAMPQGVDGKHVALLREEWTTMLTQIRNGQAPLPDADRPGRTRSFRSSVSQTISPTVGATPYFTREGIEDY
jgi:hypothetical protein